MAVKKHIPAKSSLSCNVFIEEIRSKLRGEFNYTPAVALTASAGEGWVFFQSTIDKDAGTRLIYGPAGDGSDSYADFQLANYEAIVPTEDMFIWLAIKCSKNDGTHGMVVVFDNNSSNAYNDTDAIVIGPGELWVGKVRVLVSHVFARSVVMDSYGLPSANGTKDIEAHIGAICLNAA